MTEKISWKKKIKKLQILFFILIMLLYIVYSYFSDNYNSYKEKKQELEQLTLKKIPDLKNQIKIIKEKWKVLWKISDNYKAFVDSYNKCYKNYILSKYQTNSKTNISLGMCIDKEMRKKLSIKYDWFIKLLKDSEIQKIAISFGVNKTSLPKFDIDQKRLLSSLDGEIFDNALESKISVLSLWKPVLLDKKLNLYKSSFTFTLELNYNWFKKLLDKLQNKMYINNYNYYTISNISDFDIVKPNDVQKITLQWNFYFTK